MIWLTVCACAHGFIRSLLAHRSMFVQQQRAMRCILTIRIRIIPTKSLGCCPSDLVPMSPTTPIATPAASPLNPPARPAATAQQNAKRALIVIRQEQSRACMKVIHERWEMICVRNAVCAVAKTTQALKLAPRNDSQTFIHQMLKNCRTRTHSRMLTQNWMQYHP